MPNTRLHTLAKQSNRFPLGRLIPARGDLWICVQPECRQQLLKKKQVDRFSMQNVLFNTSEPTTAEGLVEFYAVSIALQDDTGQVSSVQEVHGWWNNQTGKVTFDEALSAEQTFESFGEAVEKYCVLRVKRARAGFVHSFSWHCFTGTPSNYKRIELPVDSRC